MSRRVLVARDDSEDSRVAFEYALEVYPEAKITALHVFDPTASPKPSRSARPSP